MKQDDRQLIRSKVMQSIDMSGDIGDEQVSDMIDRCILESESGNVLSVRDKLALKKELFNSLRRLDILSELLDDEAVTEIMINGYSNIFVERAGRMYRYDKAFESEDRLKTIIQSIVAECNRIVNEASPIVDARLKDGSRVNVVLPPVSLSGSVMTIRKFPKDKMTMDKLVEIGSVTMEVADFLKNLVVAGYNIIISGGTGAGKTTFFNIATGIYTPTSGDIRFYGESLVGLEPNQIVRRGVCRTFQNIRLFQGLTVLENVMIGADLHEKATLADILLRTGRFRAQERRTAAQAAEILDYVGILSDANELARNLPYGKQRRLEIARALATRPRLLLLDEPTAGMNPSESEEMVQLFLRICSEKDVCVLMIEHDMKVVMGVSQKILVLNFGRQIAFGSPQEVLANEAVVTAYLGHRKTG